MMISLLVIASSVVCSRRLSFCGAAMNARPQGTLVDDWIFTWFRMIG